MEFEGQVGLTLSGKEVKLLRSRRQPLPTGGDRRRQQSRRDPPPESSLRRGAMHRVIGDPGVRVVPLGRTRRRRSGVCRFQIEGARPEPRRDHRLGWQHAGAQFDGGPRAPSVGIPASVGEVRSLLRVERASPTPTCRDTRCPASAPLLASLPGSRTAQVLDQEGCRRPLRQEPPQEDAPCLVLCDPPRADSRTRQAVRQVRSLPPGDRDRLLRKSRQP